MLCTAPTIFHNSSRLLIVGDFNLNWLNTDDNERVKLFNILESLDLIQHISDFTHDKEHLLDFIIYSKTDKLISMFLISFPITARYKQ